MRKILLLEAEYFGYNWLIKKKKKKKGFMVDWMDDRPSSNLLSKGLIRINPKLQKRKISNYFYKSILAKAVSEKYDYVIVILGQSFNSKMFNDLRKQCPNTRLVLYLWDSVKNFPQFKDLSKPFDVTYSFDKEDCEKYGFKFMPLFYSNECKIISESKQSENSEYDVLFIGTIKKGKLPFLDSLKNQLSSKYHYVFFYYYLQSRFVFLFNKLFNKEFKQKKISSFKYRKLSYAETLNLSFNSKIVLDVPMANQNGLSMRTFETLAMHKKLITTNKSIMNYDFYNPKNIYVFEDKINFDDCFFKTNFDNSVDPVFEQYSIDNWVEKLLKKEALCEE